MLILNDMPAVREPAYRRIAEKLRKTISDGRMAPGARLASERALAGRHGVSLMTARRAMVELIGAGSFVAPAGGGVRRLRDPHEEFHAPACTLVDGAREWRAGKVLVVVERVTLTEEGALGARPLLEFLGEAAVHAAEEIWVEGEHLHIRQTIYSARQELLAVREMEVRGRRVEGWVGR